MDLTANCQEALELYPGEQLRGLRRSRDVSQRQLAELSGVDQSVISRLERGGDAFWSTWRRLFAALDHYAVLAPGFVDEGDELLEEEKLRRKERMEAGRMARWR